MVRALTSSYPDQWEIDEIQYRSKTGRYFFHVCVNQQLLVKALYDPGAEATLLNQQVYEKWPDKKGFPCQPAVKGLTSAFGHSSRGVPKSVNLPLSAMGKRRDMEVFVVPNLNVDMIAGSDFVEKFVISLDAKKRRLVTDETIEVLAVNSEYLEPFESKWIDCRFVSSKGNLARHVVVEGRQEREGLFIPPVLVRNVSEGGVYRIPIWNYSAQPLDTRQVCSVVGRGVPARKAVPASHLLIGELPMPPLTPVPEAKAAYLKEKLRTAPKVSVEVKKRLEGLVLKYHQAFGAHPYDLGRTETYSHKIQLKNPDQAPIFSKQFPLAEAHRRVVLENVEEMLKLGVIRPTRSPWNSSVFVVPKSSGGHRMVCDLRGLNEASVENFHTGQTIEDLIGQVGALKGSVFSSCDILKGFLQLPLDPESHDLTSFTVPGSGQYCHTTAPQGLQGSVYAFWALMNSVTYGLKNSFAYMDDLLTASQDETSHLTQLEQLFRRIIQHKLTLNIEKCEFLKQEIQFLGFELSGQGVRPGRPKIEVLQKCPPPSTVKEIKSFLGLGNFFYRHFAFQQEAKHLSHLTRKDSGWKDGDLLPPRALKAFQTIKDILTSRPLLRFPDYSKPFHIFCDAATGTANQVDGNRELKNGKEQDEFQPGGVGAFLGQEGEDGKMYPLGYCGRGLKKHEVAYSAYLLEHLAAVYSLENFDHILRGHKTILHTDHHSLTHLSNLHKKTLLRLQEMLLTRDVEIAYTPGTDNGAADAISRFAHQVEAVEVQKNGASTLSMIPYSTQEIKTLQRADPDVFKIISFLTKSSSWPNDPTVKRWGVHCFLNSDGLLFFRDRKGQRATHLLVAPTALRRELMQQAHESLVGGHAGVGQCQDRLTSMWFWPSLLNDIQSFVLSCDSCQKQKKNNAPGRTPILPLPTEETFGARVHLDLLGEISGNPDCKYIMVVTDAYSKLAEFVPCRSKEAPEIAEKFWSFWCMRYGTPIAICTDGGLEFRNKFMARLADHLGMERRSTTPYHPQCNSQAEVLNKTAARYIRSFLDHKVNDVAPYLAALRFSYNTARHKATGFSPHELVYHSKPRYPYFDPEGVREMFYGEEDADTLIQRIELTRQIAVANGLSFKEAYSHKFNRELKVPVYKEGDLVLLHAPLMAKRELGVVTPKWNIPWLGPAKVKKVFPESHNVLIEFPSRGKQRRKTFRAHFDRIKAYVARPGTKGPFDSEGNLTPLPVKTSPVFGAQEAEPLPSVGADFPVLNQEEQDLQAWDRGHNVPGEPSGRVGFDPISPPVTEASRDDPGASNAPDRPEVAPPAFLPARPADPSTIEEEVVGPDPVSPGASAGPSSPSRGSPLMRRVTRRFRQMNPGTSLLKALSPPKRRSRK